VDNRHGVSLQLGGLGEELTLHNLKKDQHTSKCYTESQALTGAWNDPHKGKRKCDVEHCLSGVLYRSSSLLTFAPEYQSLYSKFTNIREHNNYLSDYMGYILRPVNRSLSDLQQNRSEVLLENWDPNILYSCKQM